MSTQQVELPMLDLDHPSLKPKVEYYNLTAGGDDHGHGHNHSNNLTGVHSHSHHGDHEHPHHETNNADVRGDIVEENKKHFNKIAAHNHDDPRWITLAQRSAAEMLKKYNFDKKSTVVMDFATNAGLIARELEPHSRKIVGVDISEVPVRIFNEWVSKKGIPSEKMSAVAVELKGEEGELDGMKFDVITCAASYHHFEDINKITSILSSFLNPSGVLLVVDLTKVDSGHALPSDHSHDHFVPHKAGLTKEGIKEAFESAGLGEFTFEMFSRVRMLGNESTLFVASGRKPASSA